MRYMFSVEVEMPGRPTQPWHVKCPHCGSTRIQCFNIEKGEVYSSYTHQAREHALKGAQQMYDQMVEALVADPVEEEGAA